jgi:branched-subunit amino acid ABC-type transport system permease component
MTRTRLGKALRATAQNFALAQARGIDGERMISVMWFLSGAFAALGGILLGLETQIRPGLGLSVMLPMFSAATVGGLGSAYGAIAGALTLAFAQNGVLAIDFRALFGADQSVQIPTRYKDVIALVGLVLTLLIRPSGIFRARGA